MHPNQCKKVVEALVESSRDAGFPSQCALRRRSRGQEEEKGSTFDLLGSPTESRNGGRGGLELRGATSSRLHGKRSIARDYPSGPQSVIAAQVRAGRMKRDVFFWLSIAWEQGYALLADMCTHVWTAQQTHF